MSAASGFRYAYLACFSKPAEDRRLYRLIRQRRVTSVLEIGMGSIDRALSLISVCQRYSPESAIRYAAVDWFEERDQSLPPIKLIDAHRRLGASSAKVRVSPGGPSAIGAVANNLANTDLILISPHADDAELASAWFFFPRMCHPGATILRAYADGGSRYQPISLAEVDQLAEAAQLRRAA